MSIFPAAPHRLGAAHWPAAAFLALCLPAGSGWTGEEVAVPRTPWSFAPLPAAEALPSPPSSPGGMEWSRGRIDDFLLAAMEAQSLAPAPPADERTLARRLAFGLTGLPPTLEEVEAFGRDVAALGREAAVAARIDLLLDSPQHGERWGRHWLDLVRYADKLSSWETTEGSPWLYRDWVVEAINQDMPYDEFVVRQFAADLLPGAAPEDRAALGFLGLGPTYWKELALPPEIISGTVAEEWEERVDALGRTFLGLTLSCARCHDHKEDPVSMEDYYALAGVFASVRMTDRPLLLEELWAPVAEAKAEVFRLRQELANLKKQKPAPEDLEAQAAGIEARVSALESGTPHYHAPMAKAVDDAALRVMLADPAKDQGGTKLEYHPGMARDLELHLRGDPNTPGAEVPRRFLAAFPGAAGAPRTLDSGSGRLDLARALVEEAAPLAARVMVNRVWRQHFGRGLVETPSDFGNSGEPPSHPELLDDLASRFIAAGWSLKWLHREILASAAWQQSSLAPETEARDPENLWLARAPRRRLEVEAWRDALLVASGQLDPAPGGAPAELSSPGNHRRTLYGVVQRRELDDLLRLNDFPDPVAHSEARAETTSPLQQLFTLNGPFLQRQADALAARLAGETGAASAGQKIAAAYGLLFQRPPTGRERDLAERYLAGREEETAAWSEYAQALLGSNEFLYLD